MQHCNTHTQPDRDLFHNIQSPYKLCYLDEPPIVSPFLSRYDKMPTYRPENLVVCIGHEETIYDMHTLQAHAGFFHQFRENARVRLPYHLFQGNIFKFIYSWMHNLHEHVMRGKLNKLREAAAFLRVRSLVRLLDYELSVKFGLEQCQGEASAESVYIPVTTGTNVPFKDQVSHQSPFDEASSTAGLQTIIFPAGRGRRIGYCPSFIRAHYHRGVGNSRSSNNWREPLSWRKPTLNPDAPVFVPPWTTQLIIETDVKKLD